MNSCTLYQSVNQCTNSVFNIGSTALVVLCNHLKPTSTPPTALGLESVEDELGIVLHIEEENIFEQAR